MTFRNYLSHKFNLKTNFNLKKYELYIKQLKEIGATEIEHAGRRLSNIQKQRKNDVIKILHDNGLKAILYTGPFGKDKNEKYAQRDKNNKPLSLMCPSSNYIKDILLPELFDVMENYDGIFFDMPWVDKRGCYCNNCGGKPDVQNALEKITNSLDINLSINSGAPKIHNVHPEAHITKLNNFDEYVTEWNPYRWNQPVSIIKNSITFAKELTNKKIYHATTVTDRNGNILSNDKLSSLFKHIYGAGATPRLGIGFNEKGLKLIGKALFENNYI